MSGVEFRWNGDQAIKVAEAAGRRGLRTGAEHILTVGQQNAPIQSGTLRRSGTVTEGELPDPDQVYAGAESGQEMAGAFPSPLGDDLLFYISFNTPYALRQHEELNWSHPVGGRAKYLEIPANQEWPKVLKFIESEMRKALGGG